MSNALTTPVQIQRSIWDTDGKLVLIRKDVYDLRQKVISKFFCIWR